MMMISDELRQRLIQTMRTAQERRLAAIDAVMDEFLRDYFDNHSKTGLDEKHAAEIPPTGGS
jgi:low affinity Fe/Cu permease